MRIFVLISTYASLETVGKYEICGLLSKYVIYAAITHLHIIGIPVQFHFHACCLVDGTRLKVSDIFKVIDSVQFNLMTVKPSLITSVIYLLVYRVARKKVEHAGALHRSNIWTVLERLP